MEITHDKPAGVWHIHTPLPFPVKVKAFGQKLKSFLNGADVPFHPKVLTPLTLAEFNDCNHYRTQPGHSIALPKYEDFWTQAYKQAANITEASRITDAAELAQAYQFHANSRRVSTRKNGLTCTLANTSPNGLTIPCNVLWQPMAAVKSKDGAIHILFHPTLWAKLRHGFKLEPYTVTLRKEATETNETPQPQHSTAA